ncbi:FAD-dependent monooxygenase [Streptomyces sp. b94]|uniref:FAD-dependent monooxygenase n=1 Tax=Streptomyces sp. b94 TaxID=1827634 RepID=UPI001B3862A1|nr:FAD-dependent monooxygenase [Streptomyces sp. b94]MBQ1099200.1 FAD-dependent monooxygenase [Streptomyces sp. b94]
MVRELRADVVVAGGGPVGMAVAAELAGYSVSTLVVEARTAVSRRPKATTLHARTVQSLVRRGHLGGLVSAGRPGSPPASSPFHFAGIPGLAISVPAMEPEPLLKCSQEELERHFEERARTAGARILRGHRVTEVRQSRDGVHITAEGPHGQVSCSAAYLVGADGARSTVRERSGLASQTFPATVSAMAGDVRLGDTAALGPGWHRTPRGWIVAKDVPGGRTRLRTVDCAGPHDDRTLPLTLEELRDEVSRIAGRHIPMAAPQWLSRFSDFSRLARSYRAGRVLLAGDAAHVHFPIGGQGLSTGLLDAVNLGWKLAFTVRGEAGEDLLDSYDQERRPAAQRVIDNTRAQVALMRPDPGLDPLRALFGELLAGGGESGVLSSMISAQDTVLPAHTPRSPPWEGRFLPNVGLTTDRGRTDVIGLLRKGRPLLLILEGQGNSDYERQARGWAGVLCLVHAEPTPDIPCEALLVRPDGYIAWVAGGADLTAALTACFGSPAGVEAGL